VGPTPTVPTTRNVSGSAERASMELLWAGNLGAIAMADACFTLLYCARRSFSSFVVSSLSLSAPSSQSALIFAAVFVIVWVGAGVITLNAALLGGNISFLQSVCVLGYCIFPMNLASLLCHAWDNKYFHFALVAVAFVWSTRASVGFMAQLVPENKRALSVYPVLLFYVTIGWMILVQ
jgi:hypothetical protein